jgi:hypothetical protein
MTDKPTISERYSRASEATDLTLRLSASGQADVLLAAGMASQGAHLSPLHRRTRGLALTLWRMREGDRAGFNEAAQVMDDWLRVRAKERGFKNGGGKSLSLVTRRTLFWWLSPTCRHCHGRGHPVIKDSPVLDETRECEHCHGSGVTPLGRVVQSDYAQAATLLANELDAIVAEVFGAMKRRLR